MKTPTDASLHSVWGSGPKNVFAVGEKGTILHFDGFRWRKMVVSLREDISGIWGSGPKNVLAVGDKGTILHFDGARWRKMAIHFQKGLHGVWGSGPKNIFAVGDRGTILHFDGTQWQKKRITSDPDVDLAAIWGTGPKNVLVTVSMPPVDAGAGPTFYHFDGSTWQAVPGGADCARACNINDLHASAPNNFVAVGSNATRAWYDGKTAGGGESSTFQAACFSAIWFDPSGTEWIAMASGGILRKRGKGFKYQRLCHSGMIIRAVGGSGPHDVYAVGDEDLILHFDGRHWTIKGGSKSLVTGILDLSGQGDEAEDMAYGYGTIWSCGPNCVFVGGGPYGNMAWYDGHRWHHANDRPRGSYFESFWGTSATNVYGTDGWQLVHYDGKSWENVTSPVAADVVHIWPLSLPRQAAAWSRKNGLVVYEARQGKWKMLPGLPHGKKALYVWGRDSQHFKVVGTHGGLWSYRINRWRQIAGSKHDEYEEAWTDIRGRPYILGNDAVLMFNGHNWIKMSRKQQTVARYEKDRARHPKVPYSISPNGTLVRYHAGQWKPVALKGL